MIDQLPDVVLFLILDCLDKFSCNALKRSCQRLYYFIPQKYLNFNYVSCTKSYESYPITMHTNCEGMIYSHDTSGYIVSPHRHGSEGKIRKEERIGWCFVFKNSYYVMTGNSIIIYKSIRDKEPERTARLYINSGYFGQIRGGKIALQSPSVVSFYDEKMTHLFGFYISVKRGVFDLYNEERVFFVTRAEWFCSRKPGELTVKIDNFNHYGGVSCLKVHEDKVYLGLKSGNINVYQILEEPPYAKYLCYWEAHSSEIGTNSIAVNGDFIYTGGRSKVKVWKNKEYWGGIEIEHENATSIRNISFHIDGTPYFEVFEK